SWCLNNRKNSLKTLQYSLTRTKYPIELSGVIMWQRRAGQNIVAKQIKERVNILDAVSTWLKLLGLIVLAVEAVLILTVVVSSASDPLHGWHIPLMLLFFSLIVIGLFFDRYIQATSQITQIPSQSRVDALFSREIDAPDSSKEIQSANTNKELKIE